MEWFYNGKGLAQKGFDEKGTTNTYPQACNIAQSYCKLDYSYRHTCVKPKTLLAYNLSHRYYLSGMHNP